MHNADSYDAVLFSNSSIRPVNLGVHFSTEQEPRLQTPRLADLMREKIAKREFFYGIELTPNSKHSMHLDYNMFDGFLPLFTSIVWLGGAHLDKARMSDVEGVQFAQCLQEKTVALSHFSAYSLRERHLEEFLDLNLTNVLVVRGDQVDENQDYLHAADLVKAIRQRKGDSVSIGVAGYPEMHPDCKSLHEDLTHLKQKVDAGADFIITQLCYSTKKIMEFIRNCRKYDINVPIIVGLFAPENIRPVEFMARIANIHLPEDEYQTLKTLVNSPQEFCDFTANKVVRTVHDLLDSDLGVYGFQLFTLNKFKNLQKIIKQIRSDLQHKENKI